MRSEAKIHPSLRQRDSALPLARLPPLRRRRMAIRERNAGYRAQKSVTASGRIRRGLPSANANTLAGVLAISHCDAMILPAPHPSFLLSGWQDDSGRNCRAAKKELQRDDHA